MNHQTTGEVHDAGDVGWDFDIDPFPCTLLRVGDHALRKTGPRRSRHPTHGTQQTHQRRQVIGTHIEHRSPTLLVEEIGIGVPAFGAVSGHEGRRCHGLADPAVIDQLATGLQTAAKKRIGCPTGAQTFGLRQIEHRLSFGLVDCEGLFRVRTLARFENLQIHTGVHLRHRQIDDDLNVPVPEQLLDSTALFDLELLRPGPRQIEVKIGTSHDVENLEESAPLEIHRADVAAADEPQGKSGIAHFFEHLMFKGTKSIPPGEFSKTIARHGGRDNAFTTQDYTAYFQIVA
ncbi:MAG TPA: insulinase family protein, partial [Candidatus Handelsmanbacteria bacterium]|nr:insulinase family protein [Candidatus Handelsmanbacteria bacterium]